MARQIATDFRFAHEIVHAPDVSPPRVQRNCRGTGATTSRHELYTHLAGIERARDIPAIATEPGDQRKDDHPGRRAAKEFGVVSPLDFFSLTKSEIRELAPASPPGMSPRRRACHRGFHYSAKITNTKLACGQSRAICVNLGFRALPGSPSWRRGSDCEARDRPR